LSYEIDYTPTEIDEDIYPKIRDKKDYPILASAIIADVDVFITGDKDFGGLDLEHPEIMTIEVISKPSISSAPDHPHSLAGFYNLSVSSLRSDTRDLHDRLPRSCL
jgi:hypothetical protein